VATEYFFKELWFPQKYGILLSGGCPEHVPGGGLRYKTLSDVQ
jgi:hypothetical protein